MDYQVVLSPELVHEAQFSRSGVLSRLLHRPLAAFSVVLLGVIVSSAVFAPLIAPFDPATLHITDAFAPPSSTYLLGTDEIGRDLLSRVLFGGRIALVISVGATLIAMSLGVVWGGFAAIRGGWIDNLLMRSADAVMAIPGLLLALVFVAAFGASVPSLIIVIGFLHSPYAARVIRGAMLAEIKADYSLAARAFGATRWRLLYSEVLPNTVPVLLVQVCLVAASVILVEATLSFFGLGVQPPRASWGTLLLSGYRNIHSSTSYAILPGIMIFLTIWCLNTVADHVQSVLEA